MTAPADEMPDYSHDLVFDKGESGAAQYSYYSLVTDYGSPADILIRVNHRGDNVWENAETLGREVVKRWNAYNTRTSRPEPEPVYGGTSDSHIARPNDGTAIDIKGCKAAAQSASARLGDLDKALQLSSDSRPDRMGVDVDALKLEILKAAKEWPYSKGRIQASSVIWAINWLVSRNLLAQTPDGKGEKHD